jgi:tRNA nucleotidyltransferase (CCA-adding enzyme)
VKLPGVDQFLGSLNSDAAEWLQAVLTSADTRGLGVYTVGGPVRDLLLDRPLRDVDLLVEGVDVGEWVAAVAPSGARVTRHDRFGTVRVEFGEVEIDFSGTRRETYAYAGSLPRVEPGSLEEDLKRRDFSINALALPLSHAALDRYPCLIDLDDGLSDLSSRKLRILHPRSFHDDPTRILRAARLGPRIGFSLTRGSHAALRGALRDGAFGRVSGDRLRKEIVKLFDDARYGLDPSRAVRALSGWLVLGALEPGLELRPESVVPLRRLGRAITDPPWHSSRWRSWVSGLSVVLAPLPPALRRRVVRRLSIRGEMAQHITQFPKTRDGWLQALPRARGRGAIDHLLAPLIDEDLHALYAFANPKARRRILRFAVEDRARRIPINGADLKELGLEGASLGRALSRIRTAYLDGAVKSRDDALALAREIGRGRGAAKRRPRGRRR